MNNENKYLKAVIDILNSNSGFKKIEVIKGSNVGASKMMSSNVYEILDNMINSHQEELKLKSFVEKMYKNGK